MHMSENSPFRASVVVSGAAILGGILGVINQSLLAATYGAGEMLDAFFLTLSVPSAITGGALPVVAALVIPNYQLERPEIHARNGMLFRLLAIGSAVGLALAALGILGTMAYWNRTLGAPASDISTQIASSTLLIWGMVALSLLFSLLVAFENLGQSFLWPSIASNFPAIGVLVSVSIVGRSFGVQAIALGLFLGTLTQVVFLLILTIKRHTTGLRLVRRQSGAQGSVTYRVGLIYLSLLPFLVFSFVGMFWAFRIGTGSVSYIAFSQSFAGFISIAVGYGVAVVAFPKLSNSLSTGYVNVASPQIGRELRMIFAVSALLACYCIIEIRNLVSIIYQRGAFSSNDAEAINWVIPFYIAAAVLIACMNYLRNVFYAAHAVEYLARLGLSATLGFFLLGGILGTTYGVTGIAMAYAFIWVGILVVAHRKLRIQGFMKTGLAPEFLIRLFILSSAVVLLVYLCSFALIGDHANPLLSLIFTGTLFLVLVVAINRHVTKVVEISALLARIARMRW